MAVVVPNQDEAESWARQNGLDGDFNELCSEPKLRSHILEELTAVAKAKNVYNICFITCARTLHFRSHDIILYLGHFTRLLCFNLSTSITYVVFLSLSAQRV